MSWVATAIAVGGAGLSLVGANQQKKAQSGADNANRYAVAEADRTAWLRYLMQRGLYAGPNTAVGEIPAYSQGVNTRLPLWANATFTTGPKTWRRRAAPAAMTNPATQPVVTPGIQQ